MHTPLVAIVGGLVGALDRDVEVLGLLGRERRKLDVELLQMRARNLLVKFFGQHMHAERERLGVRPERDLREDLVGEGEGHDEGRVAGRAAEGRLHEIYQARFIRCGTYPRLTRRPSARRMR